MTIIIIMQVIKTNNKELQFIGANWPTNGSVNITWLENGNRYIEYTP